jgi:uncharacterized protein DUF5677
MMRDSPPVEPEGQAGAGELDDGDEREGLERVLSRIEARLDTRFSFPDEKTHSAAATLALFRLMLAHAHAIRILGETPYAETAGANVRAMFEAWVDIYNILEPGREEINARRSIIFGLLEFKEHSISTGHLDTDDIAKLDAHLAPYRTEFPDLVQDVELQRTRKDPRNSNYWSGTSRSELIKRMEVAGVGSTLRSIYKMLSWDAHHVVAVALRASIRQTDDGTIDVGFEMLQTAEEAATMARYLAVRMLVKAWLQVTTHLGIDPG